MYNSENTYQVLDGIPVISVAEWVSCGLTYHQFRMDSQRNGLKIYQRGIHGETLIDATSIKRRERLAKIEAVFGRVQAAGRTFNSIYRVETDEKAHAYYTAYRYDDGSEISPEKISEYTCRASIFNALLHGMQEQKSARLKAGSRLKMNEFWTDRLKWYESVALEYRLSPYSNVRSFERAFKAYLSEGYNYFISKIKGNDFARKVDEYLESLIISKYCASNKPYADWVAKDITYWLNGEVLIADRTTGEVMESGYKFTSISKSTVLNYLNQPANRAMLEQACLDYHKYGAEIRLHYHRKPPVYSISKISLDDRDLPHKLHNGNRVKAYYAFDVASGACIGAAYSHKKDELLFIDCMRDMFRKLEKQGLGIPMEIEVENHLVRNFQNGLAKAGEVFPFVRWCAPTNSQEKHAERMIGTKKYSVEKRTQDNIGRWYSKNNTNNSTQ